MNRNFGTPLTTIGNFREGRPGYMNPKYHRRSKSAGRILDHQPVNQVPTGTVYQKILPKDAMRTTRPDVNDLKRCDEYLITYQEVDARGNISTDLVKGEIIPTAGGGSAVTFTDVERLKHELPTNL